MFEVHKPIKIKRLNQSQIPITQLYRKYTAILYRASTGQEQGFPSEVFHAGKNLFSLQGTPVLMAGILQSLQGLQCRIPDKSILSYIGQAGGPSSFFHARVFFKYHLLVSCGGWGQLRLGEKWGQQSTQLSQVAGYFDGFFFLLFIHGMLNETRWVDFNLKGHCISYSTFSKKKALL